MTERKPRAAVTRAEFEAVKAVAGQAGLDAAEARDLHTAGLAKINALHDALMVPQPGHEMSLLDRMAAVTIEIETGKRAGDRIIRLAQIFAAIGTVASAIYAAVKYGQQLPPPK